MSGRLAGTTGRTERRFRASMADRIPPRSGPQIIQFWFLI
jgi:hypothetical protein